MWPFCTLVYTIYSITFAAAENSDVHIILDISETNFRIANYITHRETQTE